jgi:hypothetical protein
MNPIKPCKFFTQGNCRFNAEQCKFSHINIESNNIPSQKQTTNRKLDPTRILANQLQYKPKEKRPPREKDEKNEKNEYETNTLHKKNTESFEPNYKPADMRVLVEVAGKNSTTKLSIQSNDVLVVPDLFGSVDDLSIHDKLLDEMKKCGIDSDKLWKLWHGDTHMIADDHTNFKDKCPTFLKVLDKIKNYFGMDIKATRFNLYRDDKDFKPFHFDAAAVKPEKAKTQNITVGISFGRTREIAFEDALEPKGHRRVVSFPMPNGYTYAFCKDINVNWRHGVPAISEEKQTNQSRISIIAWGYKDLVEL